MATVDVSDMFVTKVEFSRCILVIPGNPSANRRLLGCKTLAARFSVNMLDSGFVQVYLIAR